jgi:hypothetical protein
MGVGRRTPHRDPWLGYMGRYGAEPRREGRPRPQGLGGGRDFSLLNFIYMKLYRMNRSVYVIAGIERAVERVGKGDY